MKVASHAQVLQLVWTYMKRHLLVLAGMLCLLIVSTFLTLGQPFFYRTAVDIIAANNVGSLPALIEASRMVLLGVLFGALALTLHETSSLLLGHVEAKIMHEVHSDVFSRIQRLSTKFHVNTFAGSTARKINRGVGGVESVIDRVWFNFLPLIVFTLGLTIVLTFFAPLIGIAMLVGIILYTSASIALNMILMRYWSWTDQQDTKVTASLVDTISANTLVKTFAAEQREDDRHGDVLGEWQQRLRKSWRISSLVTWIQFMLLIAIELSVLMLAVYLWYRGSFTVGSFIVVMFYVGQLWGRLHDIGRNMRDYLRAVAHCEEMVAMAHQPVEIEDVSNAHPLKLAWASIDFTNMTFCYESASKPVFSDFNFSINPGEKVAFVGHSGSGKSTLIKLLMRLYDLNEGAIAIDGQNISEVTQESLRLSMSLVPQDPILFHRTIAENIGYAKSDATYKEIEHAAKLARAHDFIAELPRGYDTLVGERGIKLSGGERQRVAIARAILANRRILLLDEATSSLDSLSEQHIQEALLHLMKNRTTIVIAHRLGTVRTVDRIAVLEKGRIIACAPHEELLETCVHYKEMVKLQSKGILKA